MSKYVRFSEHNEWEGETWYFFIQLEGNEEELALFAKDLTDDKFEDKFELDLVHPKSEQFVDELQQFAREAGIEGYMSIYNILDGKFSYSNNFANLCENRAYQSLYEELATPKKIKDLFDKSEIKATHFILGKHGKDYHKDKVAAIQWNGNEEALKVLFDSVRNYYHDKLMLDFENIYTEETLPKHDYKVDGILDLETALADTIKANKYDYLSDQLYKGGIYYFMDD